MSGSRRKPTAVGVRVDALVRARVSNNDIYIEENLFDLISPDIPIYALGLYVLTTHLQPETSKVQAYRFPEMDLLLWLQPYLRSSMQFFYLFGPDNADPLEIQDGK